MIITYLLYVCSLGIIFLINYNFRSRIKGLEVSVRSQSYELMKVRRELNDHRRNTPPPTRDHNVKIAPSMSVKEQPFWSRALTRKWTPRPPDLPTHLPRFDYNFLDADQSND